MYFVEQAAPIERPYEARTVCLGPKSMTWKPAMYWAKRGPLIISTLWSKWERSPTVNGKPSQNLSRIAERTASYRREAGIILTSETLGQRPARHGEKTRASRRLKVGKRVFGGYAFDKGSAEIRSLGAKPASNSPFASIRARTCLPPVHR